MVKVTLPNGICYHRPPYTKKEQREMSLRMNGGVVSFSRLSPRPKDPSSPEPAGHQAPPKGLSE
jgi:hypothetical protein